MTRKDALRIWSLLGLAILVLLVWSISNSRRYRTEPGLSPSTLAPTQIVNRGAMVIAQEDYYKNNSTPELLYRGVLKETGNKNVVDYPLCRDYFLVQDSGDVLRVECAPTASDLLASLLDHHVEIRGKYVTLDKMAGGGNVLWVGYISPLQNIQ